jgi:hypothetical protein
MDVIRLSPVRARAGDVMLRAGYLNLKLKLL